MTAARDRDMPQPRELTREEGRTLLDEEARRYLGMSGDDFLCAWDSHAIDVDDPERHSAIVWVAMHIPFVRSGEP